MMCFFFKILMYNILNVRYFSEFFISEAVGQKCQNHKKTIVFLLGKTFLFRIQVVKQSKSNILRHRTKIFYLW